MWNIDCRKRKNRGFSVIEVVTQNLERGFMKRNKERGVALILTLVLVLATSVMAVSLAFISRSEAFSSMNYRLMAQSRHAAEAGTNKAANHLMFSYNKPGTGASSPLSDYTLNVTPVAYGGNPVVLSANSNTSSNYPLSTEQTAFDSAAQGSLTAGNTTLNYAASAKLLSMREIIPYRQTTPQTIQTWEITSDGTVTGIQNANVQISAILEQQASPVFAYAAFATDDDCDAITFGGGGVTGSYDSTLVVAGSVATQGFGGNVGTNGSLSTLGDPTTIHVSLSTPRSGVGNCDSGNVTAWEGQSGNVTGGLVELPQPVVYPTPVVPPPGTQNLTINQGWNCPSGVFAIAGCSTSGDDKYLPRGSYGNIDLTGPAIVHLSAGEYNINSLELVGNSTLVIDSGPVILNVAGNGIPDSQAVITLTADGLVNPSLDPMNLQIVYVGTSLVKLAGGTYASGLVYAPNADYMFVGGSNWYGSVVGAEMFDLGGTNIYHDRQLQTEALVIGNYTLGSFS